MLKKKFLRFLTGIFCCLFLCSIVPAFAGCGNEEDSSPQTQSSYTVKFELCTDLQTNRILDRTVESGGALEEPTVAVRGENPRNLRVIGWYMEEEYITQWDFDFDVVTSDMTLYAKWEGRFTVEFYLGSQTTPILSSLVKEGRKTEPCEDKCYGSEVLGYFTSSDYTEEFDFNAPITQNTKIYIKVGDSLYYDATSISNTFTPYAGQGGDTGTPTAGTIMYEEKDGESYARVDFGHSNSNDPFIAVEYTDVDIRKTQAIDVTFKNLGDAYQIGLFWVAKSGDHYVGGDTFNGKNAAYINLGQKRNMSEDDEWITIRFNLASLNENWRNSDSLVSLRLDSNYNSENPTLNPNWGCKDETIPNVLLIKSIRGIYDEKYDLTKPLITYHIGENKVTQRVSLEETMTREDSDTACMGYKVKEYYVDEAKTIPYDFDTVITGDVELYVDVEMQLYFSAAMVADFTAYPPTLGEGAAGSTELSADGEYAIVDFGYALEAPDANIAIMDVQIDTMACTKLIITMRNLGFASSMGIYWRGIGWDGTVQTRWDAAYGKGFNFKTDQIKMSADSEWITYVADLSDKATWTGLKTITALRIQSQYKAIDETDRTNVWHIKSIEGVYDERYDRTRALVTYHFSDNVATQRVSQGVLLNQESSEAACFGYKVLGFYMDSKYTQAYDFSQPVAGDMDLYVKVDDYIYFSSDMIAGFTAVAAGGGNVGSITQSADGEYVEVDFGYSPTVADAHIHIKDVEIDTMESTKLVITMKNLGGAYAFSIYWYGVDVNGNETNVWSEDRRKVYFFETMQKYMSADGEWITIEIDLSDLEGWTDMEVLKGLRIQSQYVSTDENDLTNVWHIKEITFE